jgi:AraC-like DNA-binding protein
VRRISASSHKGGACSDRQAQAARLFYQFALDPLSYAEPAFGSADEFMRLVVYDLLGALFAPPAPLGSRHTDKLFARVCGIVKDRFADPNISPREVAAEMGISLRYLQSLFTDRGSTCSHYISSLRLDHAAHLIERRASMKTGQPLAEIAYACGFAITRILRADSADVSAPRRAASEQEPLVTATHESPPTSGGGICRIGRRRRANARRKVCLGSFSSVLTSRGHVRLWGILGSGDYPNLAAFSA